MTVIVALEISNTFRNYPRAAGIGGGDVVFSCYQKSGGPGAAVRCGDCHVRTPTTYVAGFGYRSEVNGCGALPLPPWPTHVTTCRLLFSPATCGGLGPTQSVRPRACVAGPPHCGVRSCERRPRPRQPRDTLPVGTTCQIGPNMPSWLHCPRVPRTGSGIIMHS